MMIFIFVEALKILCARWDRSGLVRETKWRFDWLFAGSYQVNSSLKTGQYLKTYFIRSMLYLSVMVSELVW